MFLQNTLYACAMNEISVRHEPPTTTPFALFQQEALFAQAKPLDDGKKKEEKKKEEKKKKDDEKKDKKVKCECKSSDYGPQDQIKQRVKRCKKALKKHLECELDVGATNSAKVCKSYLEKRQQLCCA